MNSNIYVIRLKTAHKIDPLLVASRGFERTIRASLPNIKDQAMRAMRIHTIGLLRLDSDMVHGPSMIPEGQHRHHLMPSRLALSRMASSSTAAWLILSFCARSAKSRLASGLRRTLVNCFVSITDSVAHFELHNNHVALSGQGTFLPPLKRGVSSAIF